MSDVSAEHERQVLPLEAPEALDDVAEVGVGAEADEDERAEERGRQEPAAQLIEGHSSHSSRLAGGGWIGDYPRCAGAICLRNLVGRTAQDAEVGAESDVAETQQDDD